MSSGRQQDSDTTAPAKRARMVAFAALVLANALWGGSFLLGKLVLEELTPAQAIVARFGLAALLMAPWGLMVLWRMGRADLGLLVVSGLLMVPVMMLLQFEGLARTSATNAALLIGTIPVLMALAAWWFEKERLGVRGWSAAAISTLGVVLMVAIAGGHGGMGVDGGGGGGGGGGSGGGGGWSMIGDGLVLISAGAAVAWVLVTRRLLRRHAPLGVTALCMGVGAIATVPLLIALDGVPAGIPAISTPTLAALLALTIGCTAMTYGLWNWAIRHVRSSQAGVLTSLEPLIGAVLGISLLGDPMGVGIVAGGMLILSASILATWPGRRTGETAGEASRGAHGTVDHPRHGLTPIEVATAHDPEEACVAP